jgi:hypothetical protein
LSILGKIPESISLITTIQSLVAVNLSLTQYLLSL